MNHVAHDDDYLEDEDTQKDKYLTFQLAGESYAIDIKHVVEIIGMQRFTEVPDAAAYVRGVINLRGQIIPLVDVRLRFRMQARPYGDRTCIIIVEVDNVQVGLIVDEVSEVLDIPEDLVSPPPRTGKGTQGRFLRGVGRSEHDVKLLLNIDALLTDTQLEALEADAVS